MVRRGNLEIDILVLTESPRVGNVAYELELTQEFEAIHLVFHISKQFILNSIFLC